MGEFISSHDISAAELTTAGPVGTVTRPILIPTGFTRWTIMLVPQDGGAAPDPSFVLKYGVGGAFFTVNPPVGPSPTPTNQASVITREDVVSKVEVSITLGIAPVPTGDYLIRLYGAR